jgi:hypothetical protein
MDNIFSKIIIKLQLFRMKLNEDKLYTINVDVNETYNFVV